MCNKFDEFWHQLIQPQTPNALRYAARLESLMPAPFIPGLKAQGFTAILIRIGGNNPAVLDKC
jgi:hypothetical protein